MIKKNRIKIQLFESNIFIFLYYFIISTIWTYPLILKMRSLAGHGDAWQFLWNFWWVKTALIELHTNLFFTHYLHWPNGISLLYQTLSLSNSIVAVPMQYLFGLVTTYNILVFLSFAMTGLATYLLAFYLTKNRIASFAAGYIVAFSPYHFAHYFGHLNLLHFEWVPLYILYLIKMAKGESSWKLPAVFLVLTAFTDLYYLLYLILFTILFFAFNLITNKKMFNRDFIGNLIFMVLISGLVLSPYLGSMVWARLFNNDFNILGHDPVTNSTDLFSFFIPNYISYFKQYTYNFWSRWTGYQEGVGYLGYGILFLVFYALWKIRDRNTAFWTFCASIFGIFSLGPFLHINGQITNIKLPYLLLDKYVPFFSITGVPTRMTSIMFLSLAMLSAYSIASLLTGNKKYKIFLFILLPLIIFEYAPTRLEISKVTVPSFYMTLAKDKQDYTILDVSDNGAKILFYQTVHNKRLIGGYTSRPTVSTNDFLQKTPVISNIFWGKDLKPVQLTKGMDVLSSYNVKYILIAKEDLGRANYLEALGLKNIYNDQIISVFIVY